jgi:hypothetical protein
MDDGCTDLEKSFRSVFRTVNLGQGFASGPEESAPKRNAYRPYDVPGSLGSPGSGAAAGDADERDTALPAIAPAAGRLKAEDAPGATGLII